VDGVVDQGTVHLSAEVAVPLDDIPKPLEVRQDVVLDSVVQSVTARVACAFVHGSFSVFKTTGSMEALVPDSSGYRAPARRAM
jgi:hypothetical protein